MTLDAGPYRVVRVPVWGRDDKFGIVGRPMFGTKPKTPDFKSREAAQKLCDRMNIDYHRYTWAIAPKKWQPVVHTDGV